MKNLFLIIQIVTSLLLVLFILIQGKGAGLEASWSGSGDIFRTKRGAEKIIFIISIVVALIFLLSSLANTLIG